MGKDENNFARGSIPRHIIISWSNDSGTVDQCFI